MVSFVIDDPAHPAFHIGTEILQDGSRCLTGLKALTIDLARLSPGGSEKLLGNRLLICVYDVDRCDPALYQALKDVAVRTNRCHQQRRVKGCLRYPSDCRCP